MNFSLRRSKYAHCLNQLASYSCQFNTRRVSRAICDFKMGLFFLAITARLKDWKIVVLCFTVSCLWLFLNNYKQHWMWVCLYIYVHMYTDCISTTLYTIHMYVLLLYTLYTCTTTLYTIHLHSDKVYGQYTGVHVHYRHNHKVKLIPLYTPNTTNKWTECTWTVYWCPYTP